MSNCKHYSHLECLRKYHLELEGIQDHSYQKQVNGFSFGEFMCPVCKCINNGILPSYSLEEASKMVPDLNELSGQSLKLLDFYMDMFSELIKAQQGFTRDTYTSLT